MRALELKEHLTSKLRDSIISSMTYGVTQKDVANKLGVHSVTVNEVLNFRSKLGVDKIISLLGVMGVSVSIEVSFDE